MAIAYQISAVTVGTTELSIISGTTTLQSINIPGVYSGFVDYSNVVKGDEYIFRIYVAAISGGTQLKVFQQTLAHGSSQILPIPPLKMNFGVDFTLQKISGTDRTFTAGIDRD